jgi:hypothetical protein
MRKMNSFLSGLSPVGGCVLTTGSSTKLFGKIISCYPSLFIDEMLERLANHSVFCYLDGYFGYHQILIHLDDQSKTTFTCPYGTFAYRRMSFALCNALALFQRCMMVIFSDLIEKVMEVFMDDFSIYGKTFEDCLANLDKVLKQCQEADLVQNW